MNEVESLEQKLKQQLAQVQDQKDQLQATTAAMAKFESSLAAGSLSSVGHPLLLSVLTEEAELTAGAIKELAQELSPVLHYSLKQRQMSRWCISNSKQRMNRTLIFLCC